MLSPIKHLIIFAFTSITCLASANSDLPILNYFPRCDYTVIQQFVITDQLLTVNALQESNRQELLHRLIEAARIKSTDIGAEAIILQDINTKQSKIGGIVNANSDTHRIKIDVYADAIKLCEEDKNAVVIPTPYNEMGSRNARKTIDTLFSLTINMERNIREHSATKLQQLDPVVSLSQGFHGVKPGMTVTEVTEIWGAPGAKFQLQPQGYTALAFGKRYWITFYQDKVVSVETYHPLLSADISHQLPENSIFTELYWALDGTFGLRAPFKNIKAKYPELLLIEGNLFSLKNPLYEIQLEFNNYQDLHSGISELFLDKLKLKAANFATKQQPSLILNTLKLDKISTQHQPFNQAFWHELLQPLPAYNSIELKDSEIMVVFSSSIVAVFRGQKLVEVQLIPVSQNQDSSIVQNTLKSLKLPESKNAFLKLFPDAFDSIGKLTHYGDEMEVRALYSQNDDHPIDSIVIRFM